MTDVQKTVQPRTPAERHRRGLGSQERRSEVTTWMFVKRSSDSTRGACSLAEANGAAPEERGSD